MGDVLLTFTGFHDPFAISPIAGKEEEGPILSLLRAKHFDRVILLSTPRTEERTSATGAAIAESYPDVSIERCDLPLEDPTDYLGILRELRGLYQQLSPSFERSNIFVGTASGTPQMHACWLMLAASGEIPARLLQSRPAHFVTDQKPLVSEIDVSDAAFPTIRSNLWADIEPLSEATDPNDVIRRIGIVGEHPLVHQALETAQLLSDSDVPVLIVGESGTGKEKFARLIHELSARKDGPYITVNCAAIPSELAESTLFGHKKGAFTGATADLPGKFASANGGTIFLDEVGELPLDLQPKLLRTLQESEIEPVGSGKTEKVDVRIVAATNRVLKEQIADKKFREDLYYRLCVGEIRIPPLRERLSDIPKLAIYFLDQINERLRRKCQFSPEALASLQRSDYPGNVRQLQNVVHRAALLVKAGEILPENIELALQSGGDDSISMPNLGDGFSLEEYVRDVRRRLFAKALEIAKGNQSEAARLLGMSPQAVSKYMREAGQTTT